MIRAWLERGCLYDGSLVNHTNNGHTRCHWLYLHRTLSHQTRHRPTQENFHAIHGMGF